MRHNPYLGILWPYKKKFSAFFNALTFNTGSHNRVGYLLAFTTCWMQAFDHVNQKYCESAFSCEEEVLASLGVCLSAGQVWGSIRGCRVALALSTWKLVWLTDHRWNCWLRHMGSWCRTQAVLQMYGIRNSLQKVWYGKGRCSCSVCEISYKSLKKRAVPAIFLYLIFFILSLLF